MPVLSQVGNWKNHKRDLNGDNDRADANEFQEDRTFNAVNELLKRELNTDNNNGTTGGTAPYDVVYDPLTYDGSGNLTDDAQDYEYVYSAWNQLRKVNRTDDQTPIAEFYYNALGYLIQVYEDSDTDGELNPGGDFRYYRLYDASWRHLGSYRASDGSPKERLVYHNAGLGGRGGSSYIDDVILKDSDTAPWTSAGSGSLGVRRYYCQNWRHDVSAILTDTGKLVEWVKYSAYGEPTRLAAGDADGDTRYTAADDALITGGGAYRVLEDPDLDGDNDASDATHASSITGGYQSTPGYGLLSYSYTANRKGYAGYEHATPLAGAKAHIRHRFYNAALRWNQRDPMGSRAKWPSLYAYGCEPLETLDPMGLLQQAADKCYMCPEGFGTQKPLPLNECDKCCKKACDLDTEALGVTACCGKTATSCTCPMNIKENIIPKTKEHLEDVRFAFINELIACAKKHEDIHVRDIDCSAEPLCGFRAPGYPQGLDGLWRAGECGGACSEAEAYADSLACVQAIKCIGKYASECERLKRDREKKYTEMAQFWRNECNRCRSKAPEQGPTPSTETEPDPSGGGSQSGCATLGNGFVQGCG